VIKLFAMDVDGVLTDAGMYYSSDGVELKKFSTYDGMAISLLRKMGIKTAIITSENTKIVEDRAKKMKVDYVFQGVEDKLSVARDLCKVENISLDDMSYIGDDINDLELLQEVKHKACPKNAMRNIKSIKNIVRLETDGGFGAVREFVEVLISRS